MADALTKEKPRGPLRHLLVGMVCFIVVVGGATVTYHSQGWEWLESFYFVIITVFGVGYEEVHDLAHQPALQLITIAVIILGAACVLYLMGGLVGFIAEDEIRKVMDGHFKNRKLEDLKGHTIICGYGRLGQIVAAELQALGSPFVIVDRDPQRLAQATGHKYLTLEGNAVEDDVLAKAGIAHAKSLASVLPNDATNVFIALTARTMNPKLRIIARAEDPSTEKKLLQAGADEVVLPAKIGGYRVAHSITRPSLRSLLDDGVDMINQDLKQLGVELDEIELTAGSQLIGRTIGDFLRGMEGETMVLAVRRNGEMIPHPGSSLTMERGDIVIAMGHEGILASLQKDHHTNVRLAGSRNTKSPGQKATT